MKTSLLQILTDPASLIMAMEESAFNALVEEAARELPALLLGGGLFSRSPRDSEGESRASLAAGVPDRYIETNEQLGIALVTVRGMITPYADDYWGGAVDPRGLARTLTALSERVQTIVLYIDSPGGHALGMTELSASMAALREKVELVAYADTLMASAAYWTGANCHAIYAAPSANVGSIGVYSVLYTFEGLFSKLGITANVFRDGPLKGTGIMGKPLTPAESAHIEAGVQRISAEFKSHVRSRRSGQIADDTLHGQCFTGTEAATRSLVDGTFESIDALLAAIISTR